MINVLIADDSQIMRQIIRKNLESLREDANCLCVEEVVSGRKAVISMERDEHINLLFLDLNMPDLKEKHIDGMDVVTYLHQKEKLENMHVIIISANLTKKVKERLEKFGIEHFIPKPFDKDKFMSVILPIFSQLEDDNAKH
jgi:CheY-like chemotaxis protein